MSQEYRVIIDSKLPESAVKELEKAVRSSVVGGIAKLDLAKGIKIGDLPKEIGDGHIAGMIIKL